MNESSSCHASSHTRRDVSLTSSSSPRFQSASRSAPYWITLRKNEKNMPSIPWKPFGLNNILPRRFPRQRRGNKRQPIVPLKEWKIVRGDTVRKRVIQVFSYHVQNVFLCFKCMRQAFDVILIFAAYSNRICSF